jgi:hypothetical protein
MMQFALSLIRPDHRLFRAGLQTFGGKINDSQNARDLAIDPTLPIVLRWEHKLPASGSKD